MYPKKNGRRQENNALYIIFTKTKVFALIVQFFNFSHFLLHLDF